MKKIFLFTFLSSVILFSCKPELKTDFNFLVGGWKMETSDSSYILEVWSKVDSNNYEGFAYNITPNGMDLSEELQLEITEDEINYIPLIGGDDSNNPIKFKLISTEKGQYVFENKENSFPTQISYQPINDSTMHATLIDSAGNGTTTFKYQKVNG